MGNAPSGKSSGQKYLWNELGLAAAPVEHVPISSWQGCELLHAFVPFKQLYGSS